MGQVSVFRQELLYVGQQLWLLARRKCTDYTVGRPGDEHDKAKCYVAQYWPPIPIATMQCQDNIVLSPPPPAPTKAATPPTATADALHLVKVYANWYCIAYHE